VNKFDDLILDPKSNDKIKEFAKALHSYAKGYIETYRLKYCIDWIEKRLQRVSNENVKKTLILLKQHFIELRSFYKRAANVIFPLYDLAIKLSQNDITEDLAIEIVTLIIKLKELNLEEDDKNVLQNLNLKFSDLINGSKNKRVSIFKNLVNNN